MAYDAFYEGLGLVRDRFVASGSDRFDAFLIAWCVGIPKENPQDLQVRFTQWMDKLGLAQITGQSLVTIPV